jgi:fatty-acyl-CoA synthase
LQVGAGYVYDDDCFVLAIGCQLRQYACEMSTMKMDGPTASAEGANTASRSWMRALEKTAPISAQRTRLLANVIEELAVVQADAPALIAEHENLSYGALAARVNQYARWAQARGLQKSEVVCLLMPNRPEYLAIWLGITRVGGVVALLNTNLAGASLAHCITIAEPKYIIVDAELMGALDTVRAQLPRALRVWTHGGNDQGNARIDRELDRHSGAPLSGAELPTVSIEDHALYIYTSGTTGLPKAATVSHYRIMNWSYWFGGMMDTRSNDRMYNCLPLYHSVGGIVAVGALLVNGGSVVIRETFSARHFWNEIVQWDCTLFQYIGELCRYLVNTETNPGETKHRIRLACGNGLRPDVWEKFKSRFRIPQILEFYAATEGNFSLYNAEGESGAIGRIPPFLAHRLPTALVKFDFDRNEPVRNADGFCILCASNEAGEAIGKIPAERTNLSGQFEGYTNKQDSEMKILRNVLKPGDAWFRTGDLMRKDKRGFFYFVDRIGDTFRWKGENVATSEVAEAMTTYPGLVEANVYGVAVPGADGKVGMASVIVGARFDLKDLRQHLARSLPSYARPLFVRIQREIDVTATFKHKKAELAQMGFDPSKTGDEIYFNDAEHDAFVRLDGKLFARIQDGQVRL